PHHPTQNDQPERQPRSGPGQPPEETGAVGMGLETQGIRPPQVSGGKRKVRGSPLSTLYLAMPSPVTDQWGERLPRHLGLWSAIAVLVGSTIGSGIFRVPAGVAQRLQDPGPVVVAWIIGGAVALFGALTLAELAAALPRSGGVFAYLLEGFGPLPAFLFGWSELTVIRASALGAISTIFAEYLGYFLKFTPSQVQYVAAVAIVVMGVFNYLGVRTAAAVMNLVTVAKYAALAGLALLAFAAGRGSVAPCPP